MKFIVYILIFTSFLFSQDNFNIKYFEDSSKNISIEEIYNLDIDKFKPLREKKFGFTNSAYWLKININSSDNKTKILEFLDSRLDFLYLYNDKGVLLNSMGDMLPFINRYYNDPNITLPLMTNSTYYIKLLNKSRMNIEYKLWEKEEYLAHVESKNLLKAFYFGALIIMLIYNFVIFLFLKERAILDYVIYHIGFMYLMIYYNGISAQLFFPTEANLDASTVLIHVGAFCTIMATQFIRSFLNTKIDTPKIDKILLFFMLLHLISGVLSFLEIGYHINHIFFNITMMIESLFLLYVGLYIYIVKKNKVALFYFFGWLMMMIGIILTSLTIMNIIPRNDFTSNILQLGSLFEISLLSMGIAYRYKLKQEELLNKNTIIQDQSKLASMGEMLQNIAHQWRQPLSEINAVAMKIDADFYKKRLDALTLEEDLQRIENITYHMSNTIESFNSYFKDNKQLDITTLEIVINKALNLMDGTLKDIEIKLLIEDKSNININISEFIQVILVILNNAVDALISNEIKNKTITIRIKKLKNKSILEIEDNAGGIKEENLDKIFEPYFSTKFKSDGIGIGLYMAKMLVEESLKGTLSVLNTEDGARFKIIL